MAATYTFGVFFTLDGYGSYAPEGDWMGTGEARPELRPPPALYDDDQRIVFGANTVLI